MNNVYQRDRRRRWLIVAALWLAALLTAPGVAQTPPDLAPEGRVAAIDARVATLREQLAALEASDDLDVSVREPAIAHYQAALALLEQARRDAAASARWRDKDAAAKRERSELMADITSAEPRPETDLGADADADAETLNERLNAARQRRDQLQQRIDAVTQTLTEERDRADTTERALAAAEAERTERSVDATTAATAVAPLLAEAQRQRAAARRIALDNRVAALTADVQTRAARSEHAALRRAVDERALAQLQTQIAALEQQINDDRRRQAAAEVSRAEADARRAASRPPLVRETAAYNAALSQDRLEIVDAIDAASQAQNRILKQLRELNDRFQSIQRQLDIAGLNDILGPLLRKERYELPDVGEHRTDTAERQRQLAAARLRQFQLDEQRLQGEDLDAQIETLLTEQAKSADTASLAELAETLRPLLRERATLLTSLSDTYAGYIETLESLDQAQRRLIDAVGRYRALLDESLFWVPSVEPIDLTWPGRLQTALGELLAPARWWAVARSFGSGVDRWTGALTLLLLAWVGLTLLDLRLRHRLRAMTVDLGNVSRDRFGLTVEALVISALLALPTSLLLLIGGGMLTLSADDEPFSGAVGLGLISAALVALIVRGLQQLCRGDGLAERHLNWPTASCRALRQQLWWYVALVLPVSFVVAVTETMAEPLYRDTVGRLAFGVGSVALTVLLARVLHPKYGAVGPYLAERQRGWAWRLRHFWYVVLTALPALGAAAAAWGYYYTALQLLSRFFFSISLLLAIVVTVGLVMRWLRIEQRRLSWSQARARREAALAARAKSKDGAAGGEGLPVLDAEALDIASISDQSRGLITLLAFSGLGLGLWLVWADLLPALTVFDGVTLWHQSFTTETGTEVTAITLGNLGLALVLLALALFVARNLPGLLEIAVLQRFEMDAGNRYALTTIIGYVLTIVGIVAALNTIGVGWQKAQWLVAALSVGLGFGLQEIFANFVSGLIILLERPIRVGDTVTLDTCSGTVSRIRIRATTITDWDRKETVIPNKTFITSPFTNWTLTDPITRVLIPVGVGYDTDTVLAHRLLLEVVETHPLVLKEPAPAVMLLAFGDSALQFEVRVFAKQLVDRLTLTHELHLRILESLRQHDIEIPFPQRDLHIRRAAAPARAPAAADDDNDNDSDNNDSDSDKAGRDR